MNYFRKGEENLGPDRAVCSKRVFSGYGSTVAPMKSWWLEMHAQDLHMIKPTKTQA